MAEEQDKKEDQYGFTPEGEALDYLGLDQARVRAIEHARDNPDFYGAEYQGARLAWEVISEEESDEYYDIRLSFRPESSSSSSTKRAIFESGSCWTSRSPR